MKKCVSLLVLVVLIVCSCATGTDITLKNDDGSPIWTKEIPVSNRLLYGVGKAKLTIESNSRQAADAAARNDLALKISVKIKDALSIYSNEASEIVASAYEAIIVQSVNLTMKHVVVEQRWSEDDGTVWSLVSFKVKNLSSLYADAANDYLNQLEERRISTENKLATLLEQLADSKEPEALELKRLAMSKASSIEAEIDEIHNSLDVGKLQKQISSYFEKNGFDFE